MNIFEEIGQSYTYNGSVSLKALEDDIVTLENQIDSYNATLREIQMRGKKSLPLVEKIRDAKIRLSLLKAVYRRESDKATPDDVIMNMLGLSAKNAKETESPGTAADKKEPVQQNFEKAEIEIVDDDKDSNAVEGDMIADKEIVVENDGPEKETKDDVTIETDNQEDALPNAQLETITETDYKVVEEVVKKENEHQSVNKEDDTMPEHNVVKPEISFDKESGIVTIGKTPESHCEYFIPKDEKNKEEDKKTVEMEKFKVSDNVYDLTKASIEEFAEFYTILKSDDEIKVVNDDEVVGAENEVPTIDCPPPTIDDYLEPVENEEIIMNINDEYMEHKSVEYVNEVSENAENKAAEYSKEPEIQEVKATVTENNGEPEEDSFEVFEPFSDEKTSLVASLCLTDVTDLVNTMRVYGTMNPEKKLLNIRFVDIRDYEVFVKLLKEREEERHCIFKRFGKKRRSIFMYVTASVGDSTQNYKYEFTNCRITEVVDSEYASKMSMEGSYIPFEDCSYHNCGVTFKYKKLKIT